MIFHFDPLLRPSRWNYAACQRMPLVRCKPGCRHPPTAPLKHTVRRSMDHGSGSW
jgi:hypothetical protein